MDKIVENFQELITSYDERLKQISKRKENQFFIAYGPSNDSLLLYRQLQRLEDQRKLFTSLFEDYKQLKEEQGRATDSHDECHNIFQIFAERLAALSDETSSKAREIIQRFCRQTVTESATKKNALINEIDNKCKEKCKRSKKLFVAVSQEEFLSVSPLVRGRLKVDEINKVYRVIFDHLSKCKPSSASLTVKEIESLGLRVSGATGAAKLKVLRALKIVTFNNHGPVKLVTG
ncbi:uncharacterized protein TRIADDRAFT_59719 [Trichoplax adhaerens]|uniref:Uncharacterized protein n=1 Tax=Trichoplax adhaerens TaxID=10228 RepID=B3S689_TRIAD|nr:hypothetical protein TRIADDRAFT_59719 [Trichoplax adhaerens]EDV21580.1 hypothetical protein TRIADDRAFT_59719 [Trichoplax adhaerens]|eukprot:XP_002115728.1 hypothetical protein TRIADDRAFT_59719 [Trichoplax adhaerens]